MRGDHKTSVTLRLTTAAGTNASSIGETYAAYDGVNWRDSVDSCDSNGNGRVFLDCKSAEVAEYISEKLENDSNIVLYMEAY